MQQLRRILAGSALGIAILVTSGCESLIFAFANRGLPPPDASVVHAPGVGKSGLALDIYRPTQARDPASRVPAPIVVFFYGGAWQHGARAQYRFVGQRLADNGMLAIVADYRTWPQAGFPAFVEDAARAVAWAREHGDDYGGDPQRLFIAGHSAGAHIAALLGTDPRYLQAHGMAPADLAGVIGLSGPYDFVVSGDLVPIFGPRAQWPQAQPINHVDGDEPPFLLIHGKDDDRVETRDSIQMARKLREHGVPVQLHLLPGAGHSAPLIGLYDPQREPAVLATIRAFVEDPR